MSRFYNLDQAPFNSRELSKAIVAPIAGQYNGAFFDAQDMSTMFQDAAGTVPVTAMEQPVGKWLDKSGKGNHATQSVTASRPVVSARYNLLTNTESLNLWTNASATVIQNPDGVYDKIVPGVTSVSHSVYTDTPVSAGVNLTGSIKLKSAGYTKARLILFYPSSPYAQFYCAIDIDNGTITQSAVSGGSVISSSLSAFDSDGYRTAYLAGSIGAYSTVRFQLDVLDANGNVTFAGDGTSGILAGKAQLTYGSAQLRYQRVNTATDYDTIGFKKYLKFDGVDDYLNLPYLRLYANGSASIVAARDALPQSVDTFALSETSTASANQKYYPSRQLASGGNMDAYIVNDAGTVVVDTVGSVYGGASDAVIRSAVDSGNNIKLFKNGALAANDNYTRSGTLTLTNTTIGASVSTTTSNYANMKLYGLAITKSALSDSERRRVERLLAYNSGAQI